VNRYLLGVGLLLLLLFNHFSTPPKREKRQISSTLFVNPIVARALSGNLHTLFADSLWLSLGMVSETGAKDSRDVDIERFYQTSKTLIFMDGNFYKAVAYSSTFLISIYKEIEKAHDLIHLARFFDPKNFKLYFLEIINIVSYEKASQSMMESVTRLAHEALKIPVEDRQVAITDSTVWIEEALAFSQDTLAKKRRHKEDLLWLLKQTQDPKKRQLIEKKLQELR
jgi:hypothetical protein